MVLTPSAMVPLGSLCPDFELPDTKGDMWGRDSFAGKPLLVIFMCNHCPYVKHIAGKLALHAERYQQKGVEVVGINSNDVDNYPDDSPEAMVREAASRGYTFPYLFDETQQVARDFDARCTPDFFLYDADHRLVYRGQFDSSRPSLDDPVTGEDLDRAVDAMLAGEILEEQVPSVGCNVKWRA